MAGGVPGGAARGPRRPGGGAEPRGEAGAPAALGGWLGGSRGRTGSAGGRRGRGGGCGQLRAGAQGGCRRARDGGGGAGSREIHLLVTEPRAPRPDPEARAPRAAAGPVSGRGRAGPQGRARAGPSWARRQPAPPPQPLGAALPRGPTGRLVRSLRSVARRLADFWGKVKEVGVWG